MRFVHELNRTSATSPINGRLELCLEEKGAAYLEIDINGVRKKIEFKKESGEFKLTEHVINEIYHMFTPGSPRLNFTARDLFLFITDSLVTRAKTAALEISTSYQKEVRQNTIEFFAALNLALAARAPDEVVTEEHERQKARIKLMAPNVTEDNAERIIENAIQPISIERGPDDFPNVRYFTDEATTKQRFADRMTQLFNLEPATAMLILSDIHLLYRYVEGTSFQAMALAEKARGTKASIAVQQNQVRCSITQNLVDTKIKNFSEYLSEQIEKKGKIVIGPEVRAFFSSIGLPPTGKELHKLSSEIAPLVTTPFNGSAISQGIIQIAQQYIRGNMAIYQTRDQLDEFIKYALLDHPKHDELTAKAESMLKSNEQRCEVIRARETLLKQKDHKFFPAVEQLTQEQRQNLAKAFLTRSTQEINELLQHPDRVLQVVLYGWPANGEWLVRPIDEMKIPVPPTHEQRRELEELFIRMMKLVFAFPVDLGDAQQLLEDRLQSMKMENGVEKRITPTQIKEQYSNGGAQAERLRRLVLSKELTVVNAKRHAGIFSGKRTALQMRVQTVAERLLDEANHYVYATTLPSELNLLETDKREWATSGKLLSVSKAHHDAYERVMQQHGEHENNFFKKPAGQKFDEVTEYDAVLYEALTLIRARAVAVGKEFAVQADASPEEKRAANEKMFIAVHECVDAIKSKKQLFDPTSRQLFDRKGKHTHYDMIARLDGRLDRAREQIINGNVDIALVMGISVLEPDFITDKVPHAKHRHESVENVLRVAYTLARDGQLERAQKVLENAIEHPYFKEERHWTQRFNPARLWQSNKSMTTESVATLKQELEILKSFAKNYTPPRNEPPIPVDNPQELGQHHGMEGNAVVGGDELRM